MEANQKVVKTSVWWKVSERVGDLHTDKKQLRAHFETIPHPVCFSGIVYILLCLIVKLGYLKDSNAAAHSVDTGIS